MHTAEKLLRGYLTSIEDKDIDSICGPRLVENPFLRPNRLVGDAEIERAHRKIFASLASIKFELDNVIANNSHAIAEGQLQVVRPGHDPEHYHIGITAEADTNGLRRFSLYADTRNVRRWVDQSIQ